MKRLLLVFAAIILCLYGLSQEPELFDYQAIIHNKAGEVVATKNVSIKISILSGTADGTVVYSEIHSVTTNQLGLVSLTIGNGSDTTGDFVSVDWSTNKYFLKVEIDATGGSVYTDMSTTQIITVPQTLSSNPSKNTSKAIPEDKLSISRKYVGKFVDFRQTAPKTYNDPNIIWIKTTMDNIFGKISAYGKKCDFSVGDNLFLKRTYYAPGGITGYWMYLIENDSSVYYRVSEFQYDRKVLVDTWFK